MSEFWIRKLRTFFRRLDLDHDGKLSSNDFQEMARRFTTHQKVDEANGKILESRMHKFWLIIAQGNEEVALSEDEFVESTKKQILDPAFDQTLAELLDNLFSAVDADHDGVIEIEELTQLFDILGLDTNLAKWSFRAIDTDGDGVISKDEYTSSWISFFRNMDENHHSKLLIGPLI